MLPVCPNMIGGILLFPKTLEEDAGHIYEMSDNLPVAYASNSVNTTANAARGSLNQTESKVLENGYKFVWEFTPSQGNGTIAAVALTSAQGGQNGYGSLVGDASAFLQIKKLDIGDLGKAEQAVLFETAEMDFERDLLYSITFEDSSVRVRKVRVPVFSIGLNERLDDSTYTVLEDRAVPVETFLFLGSYTKYGEFLDGQDGYWYGFSNEANSSGNARVLWVRVSKTDYSMTEGEWTLSNAKLMAVGERDMTGSYPERKCQCCMRDGYLYVPAYDKKGIYKINVANTADVSLIAFGFTSKMKPLCDTGTCELYLTLVGDLIVGGDFQVTVSDAVIHTQGSARLGSAATPLFQYKQFLVGWGGSYGNEYRHMYLLTPYLATINNLSSAVVKDANKTMKITYTLTEVEDSGTYVVYANVKVKDFMVFWLEKEMRPRITSSSYETYSNIVHNHIIPAIGKMKMTEIKRSHVQTLYNEEAAVSVSVARLVKTAMNTSIRYAINKKIISVNPTSGVELPKRVEKKKYHTRSIDEKKTLNVQQILTLIEASKETPIHMQVLFAVLLGLRRCEINGVKYSDIDYINRTLKVQRQLGKKPNTTAEDFPEKTSTKQEIGLKTQSSYRIIPIPDYVFEAILEERKIYEKNRRRRSTTFQDLDYICCSSYGRPRSKDYHFPHYKKLLRDNNLPDIRWYDLRSTFCTVLLKNDFNPKAVSQLMGHAKEIITIDVYGDTAEIIEDCLDELQPFIDDVVPQDNQNNTDFSEDGYLEDISSFLS